MWSEADGCRLGELLAREVVENRVRFVSLRDAFDGYSKWGEPPVPVAIMLNRIVTLVLSGATDKAREEIDAWWIPSIGTPEMARIVHVARDPARLRKLVIDEIRSERAAAGLPPDAFELPAA